MNDFQLWFLVGVEHLLDASGYDHILYICLLALAFPLYEWRKLVILVTGFTIGHSLSLAISVTMDLDFPRALIEFLISVSILATGIFQLIRLQPGKPLAVYGNAILYCGTVFFGLVHGLGFSLVLRAMLGESGSVFLPLLYFNLGLEAAQLIIVGLIMVFSIFLSQVFKWPFQPVKIIILCLLISFAAAISVQRSLLLF
jgi:hypothetical protein